LWKLSTDPSEDAPANRWVRAIANYGATAAFIAFGTWFYTKASGYHMNELNAQLTLVSDAGTAVLRTPDVLAWLAIGYAAILVPYYALLPRVTSKAWIACAYGLAQFFASTRPAFGPAERQALLALGLKFFFVPLMVNWLLGNASDVIAHWQSVAAPAREGTLMALFKGPLYLLIFKILLMVDVFLFTVGYIIEIPVFRNEIRSVDPTVGGWLVCLACYPPFNQALGSFFPWQSSDLPRFSSESVQVTMNCVILIAMTIYAWASVALGLRASNLTNRGIVHRGPYAWVRHPAYAAKNIAWWIGAMPAVAIAFAHSFATGIWSLACVGAWTVTYVLRALTEERHLLMLENGYADYVRRVRYRFVPGLC
jgi:protein-S-isoprenylcysteine O-methyltransferase Ste14